jgi:hypothetical protein
LPLRHDIILVLMKLGTPIVIFGLVILVFGMVFHFQGQGIVGPEESFMYTNPDWITYGIQITILGVLIICAGIGINVYKAKKIS